MYGFENLEVNGWEQFCANFANERLQSYLLDSSLSLERREYRQEVTPPSLY